MLERYLSELWLRLCNCGSVKENKPTKYFKNTSSLDINNSTDIKMNVKYFLFIIQNVSYWLISVLCSIGNYKRMCISLKSYISIVLL